MSESVKVAVRCRPMSEKEISMGCKSTCKIQGNSVKISADGSEDNIKSFVYNFAYDCNSVQETVYDEIGKPVVEKSLEGYNGTIFAYGQTGSGKTHTMMGTNQDVGIVPRLTEDIFRRIANDSNDKTKFLVTVSYLEIYNEVLQDLMNPSDKPLKIREHPDLGIYVEGLSSIVVHEAQEVLRLIDQGNAVRKVASTAMNQRSSRSHSCFTLNVERKTTVVAQDVSKETVLHAKLNLVDLAGSERANKTGAQGQRLKEGAAINKSLMTLGIVINALSEGKKNNHIPYRDSQLTRLLQESLGGNAGTVMIAAISPADYNFDETLSTLRYAHRAKNIENEVVRNEDVNEKIIRELQEELERLKKALQQGGSPGESHIDEEVYQARLADLQYAQNAAWEEKERISKQLLDERQNNVNTAINNIMESMKGDKMITMKELKRLQDQKTTLSKKLKSEKEKYSQHKQSLEKRMAKYQEIQGIYDEMEDGNDKDALEQEMMKLLDSIEKKRDNLMTSKELITQYKNELRDIEERITVQKEKLVSHSDYLAENEKLRAAIQAEERERFAAKKEEFLSKELEEERRRIVNEKEKIQESYHSQLEKIHAKLEQEAKTKEYLETEKLTESLRRRHEELRLENEALTGDIGKLQEKVVESEVLTEKLVEERKALDDEVQGLQHQLKEMQRNDKDKTERLEQEALNLETLLNAIDQKEAGKAQEEMKKAQVDEEHYRMVKVMMDAFNDERREMEAHYNTTVSHLQSALKDLLYLQSVVTDLEEKLRQAIIWEPSTSSTGFISTENQGGGATTLL